MSSRFHKAFKNADAEFNRLIVEEKRYSTEIVSPLALQSGDAYKAWQASGFKDSELERIHTPLYRKWAEESKKLSEISAKRRAADEICSLRKRQLDDFLERKKKYDSAKARKADREAKATVIQSKCIEIGIMKIYMPL
jgi:hypothetical protein